MCPGDKRTLTIQPEWGYGSRGMGPIPADSVLSKFYSSFFQIVMTIKLGTCVKVSRDKADSICACSLRDGTREHSFGWQGRQQTGVVGGG